MQHGVESNDKRRPPLSCIINASTYRHAAQPQLGFRGSGQSGMERHYSDQGLIEFGNVKAGFGKSEGSIALDNGAILLVPYDRPKAQAVISAIVEP